MTTGSSIMPQKRNYDFCELFRAKSVQYFGYVDQIRNIYLELFSGYQRDLQITKEILISAWHLWEDLIDVMSYIIEHLVPNTDILTSSMTEDIFLTEKVYEYVNKGLPFREAYQKVKEEYFS